MCTPARAVMLSRNAVDGLLLLELTEEDLEAELRIDDELHRSLIMGALKDIVGTVLLHTSIYRGIHPFIEAYILWGMYYCRVLPTGLYYCMFFGTGGLLLLYGLYYYRFLVLYVLYYSRFFGTVCSLLLRFLVLYVLYYYRFLVL